MDEEDEDGIQSSLMATWLADKRNKWREKEGDKSQEAGIDVKSKKRGLQTKRVGNAVKQTADRDNHTRLRR